jgi:hypothetical protein
MVISSRRILAANVSSDRHIATAITTSGSIFRAR